MLERGFAESVEEILAASFEDGESCDYHVTKDCSHWTNYVIMFERCHVISVLPNPNTLTHTLTLLYPHTPTPTPSLLHPHTPTPTPSLPHPHTPTPSHSHTLTSSHSHTLSPSHSHTLTRSHSHTLTPPHPHTHSQHLEATAAPLLSNGAGVGVGDGRALHDGGQGRGGSDWWRDYENGYWCSALRTMLPVH